MGVGRDGRSDPNLSLGACFRMLALIPDPHLLVSLPWLSSPSICVSLNHVERWYFYIVQRCLVGKTSGSSEDGQGRDFEHLCE